MSGRPREFALIVTCSVLELLSATAYSADVLEAKAVVHGDKMAA